MTWLKTKLQWLQARCLSAIEFRIELVRAKL